MIIQSPAKYHIVEINNMIKNGGREQLKKLFTAIAIIAVVFCMPFTALAEPVTDLGDAVIYWQELAVKLAAENATLTKRNETLTHENATLKADLADAESVMSKLQSNVNDMTIKVREAEALRVQADADLASALAQIKVLEELVRKLSGPRFGALVGATYVDGQYGIMAGVTVSLK